MMATVLSVNHGRSQGVQLVHPQDHEKNFLGIFVRWGKNGAEFGEVHPHRWDKKVAVYDVYDHVREGDD